MVVQRFPKQYKHGTCHIYSLVAIIYRQVGKGKLHGRCIKLGIRIAHRIVDSEDAKLAPIKLHFHM